MKHLYKYGVWCLSVVAVSASFLSCSDDAANTELNAAVIPGSITMVLPDNVQRLIYTDDTNTKILPLIKGETVTADYKITPDDVTFDDCVWTSSNASVATVSDGNISALSSSGSGYSIITVAPTAIFSGSGIYSSLKVVVSDELIEAQSIALSSPSAEVYAGETLQMSAVLSPDDATYRTVAWSSSDESLATVDLNGLVTGKVNAEKHAKVTITATSLDGTNVYASKEITVNQVIQPEEISIDQSYSINQNYSVAIADKTLHLNYTTIPTDCTLSLIEWSSSDETIATVEGGVVTINQNGVFGDVTITATCPGTGKSSAITLHVEEGLVRELFHNKNNYGWYNASQSGNGTSSSHVWSDGKLTVTTYTQTAGTKQRGDFKCWNAKTWLHAGKYPIFAIRMQDVKDLYEGVTARNITLDASGTTSDGTKYAGGLDGNNNKWLHDYKCSDGSHVFIYDLGSQKWATGGVLPTSSVTAFTALQFKYADIATIATQITYDVYWVQTFKTIEDLQKYVESEGLTYTIVK